MSDLAKEYIEKLERKNAKLRERWKSLRKSLRKCLDALRGDLSERMMECSSKLTGQDELHGRCTGMLRPLSL